MKPALFVILFSTAVFVSSCSDDDDGNGNINPNNLAGTYEYESSAFVNDVTFTNQGDEVTFPAGSSADIFVESALTANSPCDDPSDTDLELREDGTFYFVCDDDISAEQGTWSANGDNTQLTITFTQTTPQLAVLIEDVRLEDDDDMDDFKLYGRVNNFPVPRDPSQPLGPNNLQLIEVDLILDKEE